MNNPFEVLGLEPALDLDATTLEDAYRAASKQHHPDSDSGGGDPDAFARVGSAKATLDRLSSRIPAALQALGFDKPESAGNGSAPMSGDLMDLFAELSPAIQQVEEVAKKKLAAQSELARALLANEEIAARRPLESAGLRIQQAIDSRLSHLPALDIGLAQKSPEAAPTARRLAHELAFLEKWQDQVRATLMKLFV